MSRQPEIGPGHRLGPYEVILAVAQGGMARVWAAKQVGQRFSKVVAVKTIRPDLAGDRRFETMFLEEARVAASVNHPNVAAILDVGEDDGVVYLVMEWVAGETIARVLQPTRDDPKQAITPRIAARLVSDACAGLHSAHELRDDSGRAVRVVHCDVSPQNIMIDVTGAVKVLDFGVAKALGAHRNDSLVQEIKGKAAYMAPEQAAGTRLDRLSDVFALGICLYEMTTGARPFSAGNREATLERLARCEFQRPSELVPDYPAELERILLRAMTKSPMHRYPSADRMRVALEEWLSRSGPVLTQPQVSEFLMERVGPIINERQSFIHHALGSPSVRPSAG